MEAMAQLAGLALLDPDNTEAKGLFFFGGVDNCRFRKPVVPGDVLVGGWRAGVHASSLRGAHVDAAHASSRSSCTSSPPP